VKAKAASRKAGQKNKNVDKLQPESPLSRENKTAPAMKKRHMLPVSFIAIGNVWEDSDVMHMSRSVFN
jgi:hypothetical protein